MNLSIHIWNSKKKSHNKLGCLGGLGKLMIGREKPIMITRNL